MKKTYQCTGCQARFEALVETIEDEAEVACPDCRSYKIFEIEEEPEGCCGCCGANLPPGARGGCKD